MILFTLAALALVALATAIILPALLNRRPVNRGDSERQNIQIARRRLVELDAAADAGDDATVAQSRAQLRAEIELSLLDDLGADASGNLRAPSRPAPLPPTPPGKAWTALIVALIPVLSAVLYLTLGNPAALAPAAVTTADSAQNSPPGQAPSVDLLVRRLEQKLAANPDDAEGWKLAGKTYMRLGRFREAELAYQNLHRLVGDHPDVLAAWADAAVMANDGAFSPAALARIERALALHPGHNNALWMAALAAESRFDYRRALDYLERLLPLVESDRQASAKVKRFAERMRQSQKTDSAAAAKAPMATEKPLSPGHGGLTVRVKIAPALAAEVRAEQWVYVFARAITTQATDGASMPLAVSRQRAAGLPLSVTLDDSMTMTGGAITSGAMTAGATTGERKISDFEEVSVMARLSRSGDPVARPGDIESAEVVARIGSKTPPELVLAHKVGRKAEAAGDGE